MTTETGTRRPRRDTSAATLARAAREGRQYYETYQGYQDDDVVDSDDPVTFAVLEEPETWQPAQPGQPSYSAPASPAVPAVVPLPSTLPSTLQAYQQLDVLARQQLLKQAVRLETGLVPVSFALKVAAFVLGATVLLVWLVTTIAINLGH